MSRTNLLRLFVMLLAAGSGYAAVQLAGNVESQPAVAAAPPPTPAIETEDVLVANKELTLGKVLTADDIAWVAWPKKLVVEPAIRRSAAPKARDEMLGALVRSPLLKGEPLRAEKIIQANGSGILAAMLPSGYRAIAINIDSQGGTTAGGFILPNDRVDVIRTTMRPDPSKPEPRVESETILGNVRVLAIGQNIQERNGERVITGSNATLEVDPAQAELIVQAQRSGQLSLSLRSMSDTGSAPSTLSGAVSAREPGAHMMTVGVMRGGKRQEYSVREMAQP